MNEKEIFANRLIAIVLPIGMILTLIFNLIIKMPTSFIAVIFTFGMVISFLLLVLSFRNLYVDKIKYIISFSIALCILASYVGSSTKVGYGYPVSIICFIYMSIMALYLNKKIILYTTITSIALILFSFIMYKDTLYYENGIWFIVSISLFLIICGLYLNKLIDYISSQIIVFTDKSKNFNRFNKDALSNIKTSVSSLIDYNKTLNSNVTDINEMTSVNLQLINDISTTVEKTSHISNTVSSELKELDDKFNTVTASTFGMTKYANKMNDYVKKCDNEIKTLDTSSKTIEDKVRKTVEVTDKLFDQLDSVNKILKTIRKISLEVNLLSLNASNKALKAGESGRVFSVIANDVSNLAEVSKNATNLINQNIKNIQSVAEDIKVEMNDIISLIQNNSTYNDNLINDLNDIGKISSKIIDFCGNITDLTNSTSSKVKTASDDFTNISNLTLENSNYVKTIADEINVKEEVILEIKNDFDELKVVNDDLNKLVSGNI